MAADPRHRRCVLFHGDRGPGEAAAHLASLSADALLWVSPDPAPDGRASVTPADARRRLGTSVDAVVLDLRGGINPDLLGLCHGMIWGGGLLVLLLPERGQLPAPTPSAPGWQPSAPSHRLWSRWQAQLADHPAIDPTAVPRAHHAATGSAEQAAVVQQLRGALASRAAPVVLTADRGRGKSSALGLALHTLPVRSIVATGPSPVAVAEVLRHGPPGLGWTPPLALATSTMDADVIVVDEAAQLPVPLLQAIVARHPKAQVAFATTTRGYEGTGRGFVLRFLDWLEARGPVLRLTLDTPVRWASGDPLEDLVFQLLALDAQPHDPPRGTLRAEHLDRDRLARDPDLLHGVFGLLVHAHYRTSPGDLHRLLDARNLRVHAVLDEDQRVAAACLVALEGDLSPEVCAAVHDGQQRIRGHALPDTLMVHASLPDAGRLRFVRSVRIATHPKARRRGLARMLVDHVHAHWSPDLFGTMFGATVPLLRFRRATGYQLTRLGVSRGSRTGEPSAVMLRPVSERGRSLLEARRIELAAELPDQLDQLQRDHAVALEPGLADALLAGLPAPAVQEARQAAILRHYLHGPRPYDTVAPLVRTRLAHTELERLTQADQTLIRGRVLDRKSWVRVAEEAGLAGVPAAMKRLRHALREALSDTSAPTGETVVDPTPGVAAGEGTAS